MKLECQAWVRALLIFVGHATDFLSYSIEEIAINEIFEGILFVKDHYKTSFLICKMIIVEIIVLWVMWIRENMLTTLQSKYQVSGSYWYYCISVNVTIINDWRDKARGLYII